MKKALVGLVLLASFGFTSAGTAQKTYLVKISQITPETIRSLSDAGIKVFAKTPDYFVAEASSKDLDFLQNQKIGYKILDDEPEYSLYYFVWARVNENISSYLDKIKQKAEVLDLDQDRAIIKGQPGRIEELTSLGLSLKMISKKALPLKPQARVSVLEPRKALAYYPVIDTIIQQVNSTDLNGFVADLAGEHKVLIGGIQESLFTRYSYTQSCDKAAQYLKEKFESYGLSAWYDTFTIYQDLYLMDIVSVPSGETLWAVSLYSGIWKSTDAGAGWRHIDLTDSYSLWALAVPSPETLYGAGNNGRIVKSTDAGESWYDLSTPTSAHLRGAYFDLPDRGWVTGYGGSIFYTSDGGQTWTDQSTGSSNLYEVTFVDSDNGWIVGQYGTILHTTDRGTSWNLQTSGTSVIIFGVDFATAQKGWICGQGGYIRYTSNAGANWNSQTSGATADLYMISAPDSVKVWAAGLGNTVLHTTNAGVGWAAQFPSPIEGSFYEVYFVDTLRGWVTGRMDLLGTTDGGQTWVSHGADFPHYDKLNVVAELPGLATPGQECLITAHYDNTSENPANLAPGADDNASGTAAVLEAAKILKSHHFNRTIKFVGFAGEEQGLLGSQAYASDASQAGDTIVGVYNFDMIAWEGNNVNIMELHCGTDMASQALADISTGVISNYGLALIPQKITTGATDRSDHASFWAYGYPAVLGIEDFDEFNPYYHTTSDLRSAFDQAYYLDFAKTGIASTSILAEPVLACLAKPGDADSSNSYALSDIISIVNYIFDKPGCTPGPLCWLSGQTCRGDWDGSGTVALGDAIRGVNYLFARPCNGPGVSPACWAPMASGVCCKPYNTP